MIIDSYNFSESEVSRLMDTYLVHKDSGAISVEWKYIPIQFSLLSLIGKTPKWHATVFYPEKDQPSNKNYARVLFLWANPDK